MNGDSTTSQPLSKPTSLPLNASLMSPSSKMTSSMTASTQPLSPPLAAITRLLERTTPRGNEELTMEHCVAGSENAFLRSMRSPTRDNQATPTAPKNNQKRFSIEHSRALSPIDILKVPELIHAIQSVAADLLTISICHAMGVLE